MARKTERKKWSPISTDLNSAAMGEGNVGRAERIVDKGIASDDGNDARVMWGSKFGYELDDSRRWLLSGPHIMILSLSSSRADGTNQSAIPDLVSSIRL